MSFDLSRDPWSSSMASTLHEDDDFFGGGQDFYSESAPDAGFTPPRSTRSNAWDAPRPAWDQAERWDQIRAMA